MAEVRKKVIEDKYNTSSIKTETKREENYRDSIAETGNLIIELNKLAKIDNFNNFVEGNLIYTQVKECLKIIKAMKSEKF